MDVYTGSDLLKWGDRILSDFASGDVWRIEYPNEISTITTGKNGNSIGAHNETGRNANLTMRLIRGSADDKFFNTLYQQWLNKSDEFSPQTASATKNLKDGNGNTITDTVYLEFGLPTSAIVSYENTGGDGEQCVAIWNWKFARASRSIG